jgi:hypothetical protein
LNDSPRQDIKYLSFGGTVTKLITVYTWKKQKVRIYPNPLLTIPDSLLKVLPARMIPDEIIPGKGDFMVTAKSSFLPWASRHYTLPANHISITWHRKVVRKTIEVLSELH